MGLFDVMYSGVQSLVKSAATSIVRSASGNGAKKWADSSTIAPDERPYYRPDEYYTFESYPDSPMSRKVVTFDQRKKMSNPSRRGLYVAEIMLLDYCSRGKYPKPKGGYPGLWWFEYGIRDVGHVLESLERRGFLAWAPRSRCLGALKVAELKEMLRSVGLPTAGKKADLIKRIVSNIPEEEIPIDDALRKYELTELGRMELEENGYVPYMKSHRHRTTERRGSDVSFTVWDINALFKSGAPEDWRIVVGEIEKSRFGVDMATSASMTGEIIRAKVDPQDIVRLLESRRGYIKSRAKEPGDGYDEASRGYDYEFIGKDADALVEYLISIGKGIDAPAVYESAAGILKRSGMADIAADVLTEGLRNVGKNNPHWQELLKSRDGLMK